MSTSTGGRAAKVSATLNPNGQNIETVQRVVANILGRAGCGGCGRLAVLAFEMHGDPGPELTKEGVVSLNVEEH